MNSRLYIYQDNISMLKKKINQYMVSHTKLLMKDIYGVNWEPNNIG